MDGPWQPGHGSIEDYGKIASQTPKAMRQMEGQLERAATPTTSWRVQVMPHLAVAYVERPVG